MMNFLPSWRSFWVLSNSQFWDLRCSSADDITLNFLRSPVCWRVNSKLKTLIWIPLECFRFLPNSYTLFHIKSWNSLSTQEHLLFPKFWDISLTALWRIQSIPQWPFPHFNYSQNNIFYIFFPNVLHCLLQEKAMNSLDLPVGSELTCPPVFVILFKNYYCKGCQIRSLFSFFYL